MIKPFYAFLIVCSRCRGQKVSFIDYEYGDFNYREYDISNHFNEFVGMGDENGNLDYERYYPSKQFQLLWIQEYLRGINNGEGKNNEPSQAEVTEYEMGGV